VEAASTSALAALGMPPRDTSGHTTTVLFSGKS
jgi:hypothetical protein